jgi:hypothetical protein
MNNQTKHSFSTILGILACILLITIVNHLISLTWIEEDQGDSRRFMAENLVGDMEARFEGVAILLDLWQQSLFTFLFGLGNSSSYYILGIYPHVVPLEILTEEGVIGFFIYIMLVSTALIDSLKSYILVKGFNSYRNIFICLFSLWIYSLILTFKQGSMLLATDFFLYTILLGKFNAEVRLKKPGFVFH